MEGEWGRGEGEEGRRGRGGEWEGKISEERSGSQL